MDKLCLDLLQLQMVLKEGVESSLPELWLKAEIASMTVRSGHCYLDLSQSEDGKTVAQIRAVIWASTYGRISSCFKSVTGSGLQEGQQVLFEGRVQYHPVFGVSFVVNDIDPAYTVGDAERRRAEVLERLVNEGLIERQKQLSLRSLPYDFALVSSPSAAGYRDFERHLHENEYGFRFLTTLFEAPMQGADCPSGIAAALKRVIASGYNYDAVLVLRGGGGKLDLACYDDYELCVAIAECPIPVFTAIGHDQDMHLCDMVSYDYVKTPTALADYFLNPYVDCDNLLSSFEQRLRLARKTRLGLMESRLDMLASRVDAADPVRLLEKGFVLVSDSLGRPLRSVGQCTSGDDVKLWLKDGRVSCRVTGIEI